MSLYTKEYKELKRKVVLDALEKFPETASKTLARILHRDNPLLFKDIEDARYHVRMYRGSAGNEKRRLVKFTKFYKDAV